MLSVYDASDAREQHNNPARRKESKTVHQGFVGKSQVAEGDKENVNGNKRVDERGVGPEVSREKEGE